MGLLSKLAEAVREREESRERQFIEDSNTAKDELIKHVLDTEGVDITPLRHLMRYYDRYLAIVYGDYRVRFDNDPDCMHRFVVTVWGTEHEHRTRTFIDALVDIGWEPGNDNS